MLAVEKLSAAGREIHQFLRDRAARLRHLFVVQRRGEVPDSFAVPAEQSDRVAAQAERLVQGEILRASDLLAAALSAIKDGSDPRIQLELALLKAAQPQSDLSLQALLFRIEQLERKLAQTGATEPAAGEPAGEQSNGSPSAEEAESRPAPASRRGRAAPGAPAHGGRGGGGPPGAPPTRAAPRATRA